MSRGRQYSKELMDRGVRLAMESGRPISEVARDLGVHPEALRKRVRRAQADAGERGDVLSTAEREEIRRLRKDNFELRRANSILKEASVFLPRRSTQTVRRERVRRSGTRSLRGRADLPDLGRVGVRLL